MKFSIITVCKNAKYSIQKTIDSVLNQTYTNYEYIIIDGDSNDGTAGILYSYIASHMKIVSEPDKGISDAFNKGIRLASGELLFFLNSGDYFIDEMVLETVAADIEKNNADVYGYSVTSMLNPKWPKTKKQGEFYWEKALIPHQGTFFRRDLFKEIGLYNENFRVRMDYDFFYRCRKGKKKFYCNPIIITCYDTNGISSKERYLFEKEGLAVRLLYQDTVEPDERDVIGFLIGNYESNEEAYIKKIEEQRRLIEKDHKIIVAMHKWIRLTSEGYNLSDYFLHHKYQNVAIYGMGMLGKNLRTELLNNQITVSYVIDQNEDIGEDDLVTWDGEWEPVDCIVITPFYLYEEIAERIKQEKGRFTVISIETVLAEMHQKKYKQNKR